MSVDEMIEIVTVQNSYTFGGLSDEGKAIIAALRAGQAMRDSDDETSLVAAIVAWDAATVKGDDK